MQTTRTLKSLGPIDLASVRRDPLLRWMIFMPIVMAVLIRLAVEALTQTSLERMNFDLTPYYPVIASYFLVLLVPFIFGVVIGFLLLDERDDQTLIALQVTPLPLTSYLVYRIAVPALLSVIMVVVTFWLSGLSTISFGQEVLIALGSALLAPMFAMFLAAFASNKVQGFALMKGLGAVLLIPIAAYFVTSNLEILFGVFPTYWPIKAYWMMEAGESGYLIYLAVGVVYMLALLVFFVRRFSKVLHQ